MWNEHCSYKSSRIHLRSAADQGALGDPGARRERRRDRHRRRAGGASSRWRATTTRATSSPIRARRPASAASCATSSPWARARSPASIALASARRSIRGPAISCPASSPASAATAIRFGVPTVGGSSALPHAAMTAISWSTPWRSASPRRTRSSTQRRPASAIRSSISARRPAATASTAPPWRRPISTTDAEEKRPTVQVGDPFTEKLLLEACLESWRTGCVIAIQDMGAAGLTSSAVEMGAKGDLGVELDLDARAVPRDRHERLRDDALGKPGAHADGARAREGSGGEAIFRKWGLDFAVIGKTTPTSCASSSSMAARSWPICRSRSSATRRRSTTGRMSRRPRGRAIDAARRAGADLQRRSAAAAHRNARPLLEALDLRAI